MKSFWVEINEDGNPTGGVCHAYFEDDKPTVGKWILVQQVQDYVLPERTTPTEHPEGLVPTTFPVSFGSLGSFFYRRGNRMYICRKQTIKDFPAGFPVNKETEKMECRFNNYYNDRFVDFSQTDSYEVEGWSHTVVLLDIGPVA